MFFLKNSVATYAYINVREDITPRLFVRSFISFFVCVFDFSLYIHKCYRINLIFFLSLPYVAQQSCISNIRVVPQTQASIHVTWMWQNWVSDPAHCLGRLTDDIQIYYHLSRKDQCESIASPSREDVNADAQSGEVTITGLDPFSLYQVVVEYLPLDPTRASFGEYVNTTEGGIKHNYEEFDSTWDQLNL